MTTETHEQRTGITSQGFGRRLLAGAGLAGLLAANAAVGSVPGDSVLEYELRTMADSDEYFFFEDDRKKVVDFQKARTVRICAGDSRHMVPLKVSHDGDTTMVQRNDCARVEAKEIYLEPAEPLEGNSVIQAQVSTAD